MASLDMMVTQDSTARVIDSSSLEVMEIPWYAETVIAHDSVGDQPINASTILEKLLIDNRSSI